MLHLISKLKMLLLYLLSFYCKVIYSFLVQFTGSKNRIKYKNLTLLSGVRSHKYVTADISAEQLTPDHLFDSVIINNGYLIIRNLIPDSKITNYRDVLLPQARDYWENIDPQKFDDPQFRINLSQEKTDPGENFFQAWLEQGSLNNRMFEVAHDNKHSFLDLLSITKMQSVIKHAFPYSHFKLHTQAHTRTMHPERLWAKCNAAGKEEKRKERYAGYLDYHCDMYYHASPSALLVLNIWIPITPAGPKYQATTLDVVAMGIKESRDYYGYYVKDQLPRFLDEKFESAEIESDFPAEKIIQPSLKPGDVMVLTNWTIHRTGIPENAIHPRTSIEARMVDTNDKIPTALGLTEYL